MFWWTFIFLSAEQSPNNKTKTKALGFKVGPLKNKYSTFPAVKVAILSYFRPSTSWEVMRSNIQTKSVRRSDASFSCTEEASLERSHKFRQKKQENFLVESAARFSREENSEFYQLWIIDSNLWNETSKKITCFRRSLLYGYCSVYMTFLSDLNSFFLCLLKRSHTAPLPAQHGGGRRQ